MESKYYNKDKLLVLKLTEEIDECSVQKIRRKADYEIERFMPNEVIFDFDRVTFMDSSGIGMVIGRYKKANIVGSKIGLANLSDEVRKIFTMSGVLKIIPEIKLEQNLEVINLSQKTKEVI